MIYPKNRWGERHLFQDSFYQFDTYKKEIEISYEKQKKGGDKKLKEIFHIEESYSKKIYKEFIRYKFQFCTTY